MTRIDWTRTTPTRVRRGETATHAGATPPGDRLRHDPQSRPEHPHRAGNTGATRDDRPSDPISDAETVVIPLPRRSPENSEWRQPETAPDDTQWRYHYRAKRGPGWGFTAHVNYVGGSEAQRLRAELAVVIRDLLDWAATQSESGPLRDEGNRKSA